MEYPTDIPGSIFDKTVASVGTKVFSMSKNNRRKKVILKFVDALCGPSKKPLILPNMKKRPKGNSGCIEVCVKVILFLCFSLL